MLTEFRITVSGEDFYARAFDAMGRDTSDMREPLREVRDILLDHVRAQFASEGAAGGARWAPLDTEYARWKQARFPGRPILTLTGSMRREASGRTAGRIYPRRLVYTVGPPAGYHQHGTRRMPARPLVQLDTQTLRSIDRVFHRWVRGLRQQHRLAA